MRRGTIIFFLCIFFLIGCENIEEDSKNEYLSMKNSLLEEKEYTDVNELPLDITTRIDRINEEKVNYKVILNHPKINMKDMKIMVVHNYYNEDLFPSVGIFDDKKELLVSSKDNSIELEDSIKTTKNISKLNLELKLWIEYINDLGEKKEIIYKTT